MSSALRAATVRSLPENSVTNRSGSGCDVIESDLSRSPAAHPAPANPPAVEHSESAAVTHRGSWWPDYDAWLEAHGGTLVPAPKKVGSGAHKAVAQAPGRHLRSSATGCPVITHLA